jgi:hypothetical protein
MAGQKRATERHGGGGGEEQRPVEGPDEFSRRLLDLGIRDGSHTPLAEAR